MEDYYAYYVGILGISEQVFWDKPYSFVVGVARDMAAYNAWLSYEQDRERRKR